MMLEKMLPRDVLAVATAAAIAVTGTDALGDDYEMFFY